MTQIGRPPEAAPSAFYKDPDTGVVYIDGVPYVEAGDAVVGLYDRRGDYDASGNVYPSTGGSGTAGAILKGDIWTATDDGGTLNGIAIDEGDEILAKVDSPGQTDANWNINKATGGGVSLVLGETSSTAYRGDRGKTAYDHSQVTVGNPHNVTPVQITGFNAAALTAAPAETPTTLAALVHAASSKATPIDADEIVAADSAASFGLKKFTWVNIKATLKTYFDTLYTATGTAITSVVAGTGISVDNTDPANPVVSVDSGVAENTLLKSGANGEPTASRLADDGSNITINSGSGTLAFGDLDNGLATVSADPSGRTVAMSSVQGVSQIESYIRIIDGDSSGIQSVKGTYIGDFNNYANGTFFEVDDQDESISFSATKVNIGLRPTSDPHVAGELYTQAGVLMVSAG